jgi:hypothetical protein
MKKHIVQFVLTMVIMPILCMDDHHKQIVSFTVKDGIIPIKKANIPLIKKLHEYYIKHKKIADEGKTVPIFSYASKVTLSLVHDALSVRPDKFGDYYNGLSKDHQICLIQSSGQYNQAGKKIMLDVPDLTKRLIEAYFPSDLRAYIKGFFKNEDEDFVRNYCKEQLLRSKNVLGLIKEPTMIGIEDALCDLGSLFMNGYHSNVPMRPIPLYIGDKVYQTYATYFVTNTCECRVTSTRDNQLTQRLSVPLSKECLLWVVDHDNATATYVQRIEHTGEIKGCCFNKTGTNVVTYSDKDMVFSTITVEANKTPHVASMHIDTPNQGTIVGACFNPVTNTLIVSSYEGLNSVIRHWDMNGTCKVAGIWPFKKHGFLEDIFFGRNFFEETLVILFAVAQLYDLYTFRDLGNQNGLLFDKNTGLKSIRDHNESSKIVEKKSVFIYDTSYSSFSAIAVADVEKAKTTFWQGLKNDFCFEPDDECHRTYSPDGTLLMCNVLKKKLGILYVKTQILDAVTRKKIVSFDTVYQNFAGVCFSHDSTELIFLNHNGFNEKVSLWNIADKQMFKKFSNVAFKNCGVTALLKRLCIECKKNGHLTFSKNDPICKMLKDWSRISPTMLDFLKRCFPM